MSQPPFSRVRRHHWSVYLAAAVGAAAALVLVGPIAVAVVMLRCCSDSTGPTAMAWLVLGALLLGIVAVAAVVAGLAWAGLRGLVRRVTPAGEPPG